MKRLFITGLLVLLISIAQGQAQYKNGDTLYVWASSGLDIRSTKESDSKILFNIPYGEEIIILDKKNNEKIKVQMNNQCLIDSMITPYYYLEGKMVKIKFNNVEGFVFDGFISKFPPKENYKSFDSFLKNEYGILKIIKHSNNPHNIETIYNNGIVSYKYAASGCPGCIETFYIIPELSLQEGFLIAYNILGLYNMEKRNTEDCKCPWYFTKLEDKHLELDGTCEAFFSATIRSNDNYTTIKIGYYM